MKQIRTSKFSKIIAYYLAIMIFLQVVQPMQMYALTSGPTQPEFNAFTPIGTSDMVDLASGDFNYNIPVMDVGGYPINLAYNSGVTMDQEASWVGLGWNLNVGQINRQVRGLPDDFKGDSVNYKNNLKDNFTIGTNFNLSPALYGNDTPFSLGLGVQYNNYEGITFNPSVGLSYSLAGGVQVGVDLSASVGEGATLTPSVSVSRKTDDKTKQSIGLSAGLSSRKGLEHMSMSASTTKIEKGGAYKEGRDKYSSDSNNNHGSYKTGGSSIGGSLSFNNQSYTPTKRIGFDNINKTFNATIGGEVFGLEGQVRISGFGSYQRINSDYKNKTIGAYGYEYTQFKNNLEGVLDFNRENEQTVSKNTNVLPTTNYTYDVYNIEGQGVSGMYRPFRSQVGYLYNDNVVDQSLSGSFGVELGLGNLVHGGIDFKVSPSKSKTGLWSNKNYARTVFTERNTDINSPLYEVVKFKLVGELNVDSDREIYTSKLLNRRPLRLELTGGDFNWQVNPKYFAKSGATSSGVNAYDPLSVTVPIKRTKRLLTNQTIQKVRNSEADELFVFKNTSFAKPHHTAGVKVLQADGSTYIYGKTVYNTKKVEATFDVSGSNSLDVSNQLINYNGSTSGNHSANSDRFQNVITTPEYAHTYLITSVLSSDYEDIDNNGPSDNDLGTYTKFDYTKFGSSNYISNYKWRIPYDYRKVSYNEGFKTSSKDQKGSYIYGEKEVTYLQKIETKTHVAFFDLENRKDAMSVIDEQGGRGTQALKFIKSIRLYSKSELQKDIAGNILDPGIFSLIKPIKTVHFEYDYSLCPNVPSNSRDVEDFNGVNINSKKGKLTLKKVYFTYRNSNMGKYTPYVFDYGDTDSSSVNPNYKMKEFDIWGNYNDNEAILNTTEFPFVEQNKIKADQHTGAWTLKSVKLPSGGEISIETESDDYKYVQNKKAMQMFKVIGAGQDPIAPSSLLSNRLFSAAGHKRYIYVKVANEGMSSSDFKDKYLAENINKPIYFKFLLNMNDHKSDYVSGYFEIDQNLPINVNDSGVAAIPLRFLRKDGGLTANQEVNPISKAGWGFGRTNLNRAVYSSGGDEINDDFISIVRDLVGSIGAMAEIFRGPNAVLEGKGCAKSFDTQRSWVRLENSNGKKLGGGLRVKKITLSDNWDVMNNETTDGNLYKELYGQEYSYELNDNTSSGVATFEPNASPENPFVEPFYGDDGNYAERIGAPKEMNYVEKPFGATFFPAARVTYSTVTVKNLDKKYDNPGKEIKKHATGRVITEHYTTYDFPTIVDYTDLDLKTNNTDNPLFVLLNVVSFNHLVASQGFTIETNDMNGKLKSQQVFGEGQNSPISKVEYIYNVGADKRLNNEFVTIDENGTINRNSLLGIDYDVINDFNESNSVSESFGFNGNGAAFLVGLIPGFVPMILPTYAYHETILRTATTTKVVHKSGVLVEKIAYDLGSRVSTKNLAWDSKTGQVILTETINEFDDKYYSFSYPAYWYYKNMGMASENINLRGKLQLESSGVDFSLQNMPTASPNNDIKLYFKIGDELLLENGTKLWVSDYSGNKIKLMNRDGQLINTSNVPSNLNFITVRSGNRNLQMASMASVTSMKNPIAPGVMAIDNNTFAYDNVITTANKVVNASAVEYSDIWNSQCENGLPNEFGLFNGQGEPVNPFIYNLKGDWRAVRSYAYLTGRNNFVTSNTRKAGFYKDFNSFYRINGTSWSINTDKWTFASEVTKYSPYGVELENKDALNRYSAAQYGYNYTLPVAVGSNAKYQELGFDGFEDYQDFYNASLLKPHFGFSQALNTNVTVTNQKSHTGHNSLKVEAGKKATFVRKVDGCKNK